MKDTEKQVMFTVDKQLEQKFKIYSVNKNTTKSELLRDFMRKCVAAESQLL